MPENVRNSAAHHSSLAAGNGLMSEDVTKAAGESMVAALMLAEIALIRKALPNVGTRKLQYLLNDFLYNTTAK